MMKRFKDSEEAEVMLIEDEDSKGKEMFEIDDQK